MPRKPKPKPAASRKPGRPSGYSAEITEAICTQLSKGMTLREICRQPNYPPAPTVVGWANDHPEFAEQYTRAREACMDAMAEEIIEISDNGSNDWMERQGEIEPNMEHIQRSRLRVDARKWLLSKIAPKRYGERLELAGEVAVNATLTIAETLRQRREARLKQAGKEGQ